MQYDETKILEMVRKIENGICDIAIGSRYAKGCSTDDWDLSRLKRSLKVTRLAQILLKMPVTDPLSGFFAIRRDLIVQIAQKLSAVGFKILLDILVTRKLTKHAPDLRISEIPYRFRGRNSGESKMGGRVVSDLLRFGIDKTFGRILLTRLILFLMVGGLGLIVHLSVLQFVLTAISLSFTIAQSAAVVTAIAFNFLLNNIITFADRKLSGRKLIQGLFSFYIICSAGALANIGVGTLVYGNDQPWWVAGIAGSVIGAVWNYAAFSLLTWRKP